MQGRLPVCLIHLCIRFRVRGRVTVRVRVRVRMRVRVRVRGRMRVRVRVRGRVRVGEGSWLGFLCQLSAFERIMQDRLPVCVFHVWVRVRVWVRMRVRVRVRVRMRGRLGLKDDEGEG